MQDHSAQNAVESWLAGVRANLTSLNNYQRQDSDRPALFWSIDLPQAPTVSVDALLPVLLPEERERAARFVNPIDRQRFVLAHIATRVILAAVSDQPIEVIDFNRHSSGKPYLQETDKDTGISEFSLSHCQDKALLGLCSRGYIGVDIELIAPRPFLPLVNKLYRPDEAEWLLKQPNDRQLEYFLQCWTRKEAYLKATGSGLSGQLAAARCLPPEDGVVHCQVEDDSRWRCVPLDGDGWAACAMLDRPPGNLCQFQFNWGEMPA